MFTKLSPNIQAMIIAAIGYVFFSLSDTMAKYATAIYHPLTVTAFNGLFFFLICLSLSKPLGGLKKTLQSRYKKFHAIRTVGNFFAAITVTYSISKVPLTLLYAVVFTTPFVIALIAILVFNERPSKKAWITIIAGFLGVLIVIRPGFDDFNIWALAILCATFFIAATHLPVKKMGKDETILSLGLYPSFFLTIMLLPFAVTNYGLPDLKHMIFFFFGGVGIMGGLTCLALAYKIGRTAQVAPIQYSQILWGTIIGFFIFNEIPDMWTLIGATIIIGAGLFLIYSESRSPSPVLKS